MSLVCWLPLNGDLRNQGCSNVTITNNGATVNTSGKIGSCYSFDGTNQYLEFNNFDPTGWPEMSITFWFYSDGTANNFFLLRRNSQHAFRINDNGIAFRDTQNTSTQRVVSWTNSLPLNTWMHITAIYNRGQIILYQNGILDTNNSAYYHETGTLYTSTLNSIRIGRVQSTSDNTYYKGLINDFRIYDHALSAAEVREISQGLVLHYKLDAYNLFNPNTLTPDIYLLSNGNTSTSGAVGNWALTEYIPIKPNTSYIGYNLVNGGNGNPSICYYDINKTYTRGAAITANTPLNITTQNNEYYVRISIRKIDNDIYKMSFLEIPNIIEDSSGYNHNGTINGNIIISSDTNRYNYSAQFDGVDDSITVPYNTICPENIFTFNLWFKKDALGSKNYETLFGGPSGFEMDTRSGSATSLSLYMASTRSGNRNNVTSLSLGNWYMITMTRDGTKERYYVNGIFQSEIDAKSMPNGTYRIGAWASNTGQNYYGLISDFRIYCTALDADAIRQLYEVGAKVDNKGNLHTFELSESNNGRELLAVPLTTSYSNHNTVYSAYDENGEITLTGNSSIGSNYIKIYPTGHTYYYDFEVSIDAGNQVYIGFERYDAEKTSRSNSACMYAIGFKPSTALSHMHYHGTIAIGTPFDASTPVDTIAVRILNDWSGANGRSMTVHKISLREVSTLQNTKINKQGQSITTELIEMNDNFRVHKNGIIETNEIIEL